MCVYVCVCGAWDKMCKQKLEGGLSLRRIQDLNNAAGLQLVWRCCNPNGSIWAEWMRNQYFRDFSLWEAPIHLLQSGNWKFVASFRKMAKLYVEKYRTWSYYITMVWSLVERRGFSWSAWKTTSYYTSESNLESECSDTEQLLATEIPSLVHIWNWIQNTEIHAYDSDKWIWIPSSKGQFSSHSAWNITRQTGPGFEFNSLIWFSSHSPKMAICILRALLVKLPTQDKLNQYGIIPSNTCSLGNCHPDSIDHLFFECSYSRYTWALCKLKLGMSQQVSPLNDKVIDTFHQDKIQVNSSCKTSTCSSSMAYVEREKHEYFHKDAEVSTVISGYADSDSDSRPQMGRWYWWCKG